MRTLVTGGAGFIGCNLTTALVRRGHSVVVVDNLARAGSLDNLRALLDDPTIAPNVVFVPADVRDHDAIAGVVAEQAPNAVAHLAAQVTVTGSIADPVLDFDVNARGTVNVLEAVRLHAPKARLLFTSSNKVYGTLEHLRTVSNGSRYELPEHPEGVSEEFPAVAATPYGCSKLTADLYVQDYGRTYGLATTVFRVSCVYGRWQNGTVDQGWVSWLVTRALTGGAITICGDGLQVRDLLHVDDLVEAVLAVLERGRGTGQVFNVGGGPQFSLSVWREFGPLLEELVGRPLTVAFAERRPGDQHVYMSDLRRVARELSWKPKTSPREGIGAMTEWLRAGRPLGRCGR
jgi:CDP-paratose 2-epimerase